MVDWLEIAGVSAAGGVGGLIYWLFADREQIFARAKEMLARR
jgi:hypothetical protein